MSIIGTGRSYAACCADESPCATLRTLTTEYTECSERPSSMTCQQPVRLSDVGAPSSPPRRERYVHVIYPSCRYGRKDFFMPHVTRFASESVCAGHPDKIADQISDAIVDALLAQDPHSRTGVEVLVAADRVVLSGEVKTTAKVDFVAIAREQ